MTKEELRKSVSSNMDFVKDYYEKGDSQFFETMFIIDTTKDKKTRGMVAMIGGSDVAMENRREVAFSLGLRTGIEKFRGDVDSINAIMMMSEAWISLPENKDKYVRPSLDPNKKEAIISTGLTEDGQSSFEVFELKRVLDLDKGITKIEFGSFEKFEEFKNKEKEIDSESPLLKRFWDGVGLVNHLIENMPENIKPMVKKVPLDTFVNMIMNQISELNKK